MKKNIYILILGLISFSCFDNLDKQPDFISENLVFEDPNLVDAYIADLYERMNFQRGTGVPMGTRSAVGAENIAFANWQEPNQAATRQYIAETGPGPLDRWLYTPIRDMNFLLENIDNSRTLTTQFKEVKKAEVRFLRAFAYFEMVKSFGGVPLILRVQDINEPRENLLVSRDKEEEVYDFIFNELDEIKEVFGQSKTGANGRADKYAALMLQSRAMLYAGSIARNGTVQLDGVVGIPSGRENEFFQRSYDASKEIIDSGLFQLYNQSPDKVQNYRNIFLDEGNDEMIFVEVFEPFIKGHDLDLMAHPAGFNATWNSNWPVLYDFVEVFDFKDGRSGKIDRSEFNPNNLWDINDFFGNRDPRFKASVFYPETEFQGRKVFFHSSTVYFENGERKESTREVDSFETINGEVFPGVAPNRNRVNTGLLLRKRVDDANTLPQTGNSGTDYVVFRYAETLLNFAEASYYLNFTSDALSAINQLRERVEMPLYTTIDEDKIRKERQIELCFEDHRYYDLVRWRIAHEVLSVRTAGMVFTYHLDEDKYTITLRNAENLERVFEPRRYYLPFGLGRLAQNENLVQNPGF
ncbi:MAG: RagB/SusD family nutrient uptake outer membrane protein [Mongoliibacter sp.]|uniref:RagB/SusD family nutrient uptake outer membrane protein n=1 Tax=Mongoliibacter sp. TaxID=2022438 RepID=UPI0012F003CC|nr:RagB/SusD family nutrient uptake outer membrane protein [Mongoliibacter sp.]TVP49100.1 MAG: RagB/SusD family nutrient uptake outer membrane protein [Mongoliibacter sp.]